MSTVPRPVAITFVAILLSVSACGGAISDPASKEQTGKQPAAPSSPAAIGTGGPKAGDCFTHAYAEVTAADSTVPCTVKHTAEISRVIDAPVGVDPAVKADKARLDKIAGAQCPESDAYIGYRGVLSASVYGSYSVPTKEARTKGDHWLACTVVTFISPPAPSGKYTFRERTSPIKGTLTTDEAFLREGILCRPGPTAGDTIDCTDGQGKWLSLAYRPDPKPFISQDHQGDYARSFCQAAADAYGKNRPQWQAFWSATATEGSGQNCLIALKNFNRDATPVTLGTPQTKFKSPVEARFATKLKAVGERLSAEPALMSEQVQNQNLRTSPGYYPTEVQHRTLCSVLPCTGPFSAGTSMEGNTTKFTATVPFENKTCQGNVVFPLGYLGAPFTVQDVGCS